MKNLIISGVESPFLLFSLLLPVSVVAEVYGESDDLIMDAMMSDREIMRCRELNG